MGRHVRLARYAICLDSGASQDTSRATQIQSAVGHERGAGRYPDSRSPLSWSACPFLVPCSSPASPAFQSTARSRSKFAGYRSRPQGQPANSLRTRLALRSSLAWSSSLAPLASGFFRRRLRLGRCFGLSLPSSSISLLLVLSNWPCFWGSQILRRAQHTFSSTCTDLRTILPSHRIADTLTLPHC